MKKINTSIMTFIMIAAVLCVLLGACASQASQDPASPPQDTVTPSGIPETQEPDLGEISHRLLADWYGYLIRCEYLYGDIEWALSNLEPFFNDHTWDNLQIARAALAAADQRVNIVNTKPLKAQMSFEDYNVLIQSGADVSMVQSNVDSIQSITDDILVSYQNYRNYLSSPIDAFFLSYYLSYFENWAHIQSQIYDAYLRDCAIETDYLLLSLHHDEEKTNFISAIEKQCPQISARREGNPKDKDELKKLASELLDEIESLNNELVSAVGQLQASLDLEKDVSEIDLNDINDLNSYVNAIASNAVELKGFPIALPYPDWWYEQESEPFKYFWDDPMYGENEENGPRDFLIPGDTIRTPPDQFMAKWENVSLEDYISYVDGIERRHHISALYAEEKDGQYTNVYDFPSAFFSLVWENDVVSLYVLEGSVCFAPTWYVFYTQ